MHMLSKHKQKEHYRLDMESMMYATVIDSNQAEGILVRIPVRNVVQIYKHSAYAIKTQTKGALQIGYGILDFPNLYITNFS